MKVMIVFGARPNFMKVAPVNRALRRHVGVETVLVHTGQHFDKEMSSDFIKALELPEPSVHLGVGAGTAAFQIAEVVKRLEPVIQGARPDVTVVVGDVNSTLGAALASSTLQVPVAHVEAGLRSRDWGMPEERNRVLTDRLSGYLFTPSADADENLIGEGIEPDSIFRVGNVMIDSLDWILPRIPREKVKSQFEIPEGSYGVVTLHRPSNVDDPRTLARMVTVLEKLSETLPLFFPVHPRTSQRLSDFGLSINGAVRLLPALSYIEFLGILLGAAVVLTDSGGIQEEAVVLGVPCLTLRDSTERPITLALGGNQLVGNDADAIEKATLETIERPKPVGQRPPLWDGRSAERIAEILVSEGLTP